MTLLPCEQCNRHFATDIAACPFCAAPRRASTTAPGHAIGRFSRAAVFAGLTGCYVNNPPPQQPPPPPPDREQAQQEPPPHFAQPPKGTAMVRGTVTYAGGNPAAGVRVILENPAMKAVAATTDAQGRYGFPNLPAGSYKLTFNSGYNDPRRGPPPQREVTVADGAITQIDISVPQPPPPDYSNVPKPYGAPPARRRVV